MFQLRSRIKCFHSRFFAYGLAIAIVSRFICSNSLAAETVEHRLYVTDKSGISVYDIDDNHRLLRKIPLPDTGSYKGICASIPLKTLYVTSNTQDELVAMDLGTEEIRWRKHVGKYADSMAITPDGQTIYMPLRHEGCWAALRAEDGSEIARMQTGRGKNYEVDPIGDIGPHNTWCNAEGSRMYLEVLTHRHIYIADTSKHKIIGKVGPFTNGLRPFTVSADERFVFANVDRLLGFEVGEVQSDRGWGGKMLYRVEAHTPPARIAELAQDPPRRMPHSTPSHGINIHPNQEEVWVVDGVHGYVYVYDVTVMPPRYKAGIAMAAQPSDRPRPGWISFSIDGRFAYPDGGVVIDTQSKQIVSRIPTSEKLIEIVFEDGQPVRAGHR